MAQPDRDPIRSEQCCARRCFSFRTWSKRTDGSHFACANVREPGWLPTLRRAVQRTRLERMLHSSAIPLFACPAGLLERRACDYLRSHPQRGASTVCCGRVRLDCATRTDRDDPAKMARL